LAPKFEHSLFEDELRRNFGAQAKKKTSKQIGGRINPIGNGSYDGDQGGAL